MILAGCGGGGGGGGGGSTAAGATAVSVVQGRVSGSADGALVHLLAPTIGAPTLRTLGEAVLDSAELASDGTFALRATAPGPYQVLVSAPGRALTWAEVPGDGGASVEVAPAPEARLTLEALDGAGRPEPLCLAIVVDGASRPLPLVAAEVVTDESGRLSAGRLPAGQLEVLVLSGDLTRVARTTIDVRPDEVAVVTVRLGDDPALLSRTLRLAGQDELADVVEGVSR